MFLLFMSVANYQNLESQILALTYLSEAIVIFILKVDLASWSSQTRLWQLW